jgi:hypothetical protein
VRSDVRTERSRGALDAVDDARDAHGRALTRRQVALGRQLPVGLGDDSARDAQRARERARGGHAGLCRQRARADPLAQRALDLHVQR